MNNQHTSTFDTRVHLASPPIWFWIAGVSILIWNLFGIFVFAVMALLVSGTVDIASDEAMAALNEQERAQKLAVKEVVLETPMWSNVAFAVAVAFGVLGSIALIRRSNHAMMLFVISLIGVLVQNAYNYLLSDSIQRIGVGLSPFVILVAFILVPFAWFCANRNWYPKQTDE